jgi:hypothetical protein
MFRYMCTMFRDNTMQILKNKMLLQSFYLYVPLFVAALSLSFVICKRTIVHMIKFMVTLWLKHFSYLNKMYTQYKLFMLRLW